MRPGRRGALEVWLSEVAASRPRWLLDHVAAVRPRLRCSLPACDLLLWAFVAAGLVLRLWGLQAMEFKEDEFTHMVAAYKASNAPWSAPLLRAESTTVSPGIFFYQLLALPVAVTQDPVWVTRFIALVNVAAIPVLFLFIRRFFGARVALWSTALFATSPWMVVFSRKIWNPDLLFPFLIITLFCLFSAMRRYAPWKVYGFAFFFALLSQLHLSVWVALFPLLPLGLLFRPWRRPRDLAVGVAVFFSVYLLSLGTRVGEFVAALAGSAGGEPAPLLWLAGHNARWSVRLATGQGFEYLLGPGGYAGFAEHGVVPWTRAAFVLYALLTVVAGAYVLHRTVRAARASFPEVADRVLLIMLLMAASLHVLYLLFRVASYPHYQVVLMLLPPLAVALLLARIAERVPRGGAAVARTILIVVVAANVSFASAFLVFVTARPETIDGDYGRPYFVDQERWERELEDAFREVDRG